MGLSLNRVFQPLCCRVRAWALSGDCRLSAFQASLNSEQQRLHLGLYRWLLRDASARHLTRTVAGYLPCRSVCPTQEKFWRTCKKLQVHEAPSACFGYVRLTTVLEPQRLLCCFLFKSCCTNSGSFPLYPF